MALLRIAEGLENPDPRLSYGCEIKHPALIQLKPIFDQWGECIRHFCNVEDGKDAPYYYNERANISVLAGAAWKSDAIALEEYGTVKGRGPTRGHGRADLLLKIRDEAADRHQEYAIEAKHKWISHKASSLKIKERMKEAYSDAKRSYDAAIVVGCTFFVPKWKMALRAPRTPIQRNEIVETLQNYRAAKPDLLAWCFPRDTRALWYREKRGGIVKVWPGIIVAMKVVRCPKPTN